jgi:hypothetical protein
MVARLPSAGRREPDGWSRGATARSSVTVTGGAKTIRLLPGRAPVAAEPLPVSLDLPRQAPTPKTRAAKTYQKVWRALDEAPGTLVTQKESAAGGQRGHED